MYKLIIVDDEEIIRNGLKKHISKEQQGFEVVACLKDGSEAIEYIEKNEVDVVFTDIKMINVSGIEVAEFIYKHHPKIKVALISGYKEFDYAKKAIEYNVKQYLLKPTSLDELNKILADFKEAIDSERMLENDMEYIEDLLPILQEEFLNDFIMNALNDEEAINTRMRRAKLDRELLKKPCCLIKITIMDYDVFFEQKWKYGKDRLSIALVYTLKQLIINLSLYHILTRENIVEIIAFYETGNEVHALKTELEKELTIIESELKLVFEMDIKIAASAYCENIYVLRNYKQRSNNQDDYSANNEHNIFMEEKFKLLISHISSGNFNEAYNIMDSFVECMKELKIEQVHDRMMNLYAKIYNKFADMGISSLEKTESIFDYRTVVEANGIAEIKEWNKNIIIAIINDITDKDSNKASLIIDKAKHFINKNFADNLSLKDVADHVFLNSSYFSRFFKQQTGENFTDYLISIKINKAINLIRMGMKIQDISEKTGFGSTRYFNKVFKRYTGLTPMEYCRNILKVEGNFDE